VLKEDDLCHSGEKATAASDGMHDRVNHLNQGYCPRKQIIIAGKDGDFVQQLRF
jgi:hypothetical protein